MRSFICGLLLLISSTSPIAVEKENTVDGLNLAISEVKPSGVVIVEIKNSSHKPIKVWEEANSWGAAHWRVLLIRDGQLKTFFEEPDRGFTRNIPAFKEIATGGHIYRELDVSGQGWRRPDAQKVSFERGDILVVIYDVPKADIWPEAPITVEASKIGVWYGVATALTTMK